MITLLASLAIALPPQVTQAMPDHGDTSVSPALTELRIEFDQDMSAAGWSICGGGEIFPTLTGKPRWVSTRALVVPVSLQPSHRYELSVNCPSARGTRSVTGEPAETTPIWFQTAPDAASAAAPAVLTVESNRAAIEALETAVRQRYSYRDRVVKDWDVLFNQYRSALEAAKTRACFAREASRLLAHAEDLHVSLMVGDADGWHVRFPTARRAVVVNADANTLADGVPAWNSVSDAVQWGRYDDGILYLSVSECSDAAAEAALGILRDARSGAWVTGAVLDLRRNAGGDELAARRIAGVFLDEHRVYAKNRSRDPDAADGWGPLISRVIEPAPATDRMTVPLCVLTGPYCMSSCESFVLMLKDAPRVTVVGAATYGSSGNPKCFALGNGVSALLSSWEDLRPDGSAMEGVGINPDIEVDTEPGDFQSSDPVLLRALRTLREKNDST